MADDPLYQALGTRPNVAVPRQSRRGLTIAAVLAAVALAVAAYAVMRPGSSATESVAVAPIEPLAPAAPVSGVAAVPPSGAPTATSTATDAPTIQPNGDTVEYQHGVKIIRLGGASLSKTITIPSDKPPATTGSGPPGRSPPAP